MTLEGVEHCAQRRRDGVGVDADTPARMAAVIAGFNIGNCGCLRALAKRVLGVVLHIQVARELAANCSDECVDWTVALGVECLSRAIDIDVRRDFGITCGRIAA